MTVKVAINGFGRIGRLVARAILERDDHDLELVAINDLAPAKANALLFKRDSVHGPFPGTVEADGNDIIVNGKRIHVTAERDPANLPHLSNGIDIALECTGFFTDRTSAEKHIAAGAKRVLISAPGKNVDKTVVFGVNHGVLTSDDVIVSNASCTTNCLAPLAKVMNDEIGMLYKKMKSTALSSEKNYIRGRLKQLLMQRKNLETQMNMQEANLTRERQFSSINYKKKDSKLEYTLAATNLLNTQSLNDSSFNQLQNASSFSAY